MAERRVHLCKPERTLALRAELARNFPNAKLESKTEGRVDAELGDADAARETTVAFASQILPNPRALEAPSINALAQHLGESLIPLDGPWRMHAFALAGAPPRRAQLVEEALEEWLSKKQRRLRRLRNSNAESAWQPGETLVQLALESPTRALLSIANADAIHKLRHSISPFIAGRCEVPRDPRPPSRAYQKLTESLKRLHRNFTPSETVVDLGASPGGWTFIAIDQGARVTAVDRSPLRDDLMKNPRLAFVRGDAFAWKPAARVDWLICDLIAFPERTVELVEQWLSERRCVNFVVTMKFRGDEDHARVEAMKRILEKYASEFLLRALDANKNELTAMGRVAT